MRNDINKNKLGEIIIFVIVSLLIISRIKTPYELVKGMRDRDMDYELISSNKTDEGIFLYTSGVVNEEKYNKYNIDLVKKTLTGYKWAGGGGHINRDISNSEDFIISMQLLYAEQYFTPTIFGIIIDENIKDIRIYIRDELSNVATIYNGRDENEKFYVVHFERDIADVSYMTVRLIYADGREVVFMPSDEEMERLLKSVPRYINEEIIEK